jgi:dynein heavy chain
MDGLGEDPVYDMVASVDVLKKSLDAALEDYNETNAVMDLVLFEDAMRHVCRITRVINNTAGHCMLVGVGGSGKQSLSRLSATSAASSPCPSRSPTRTASTTSRLISRPCTALLA